MNSNSKESAPKDWLEGLKENFSGEITAGFVVFLLALPLSLGIAQASNMPPIMGLVTAIVGGVVVSFFTGSKLSIKGPAAGLIVIVAGAVTAFGGGENGWKLALSAMVVAGLLQILFGFLKLGRFVDFFPLSAIKGMLAAIGLIIIAKQIPVLLNVNPELAKDHGPIALLGKIPLFLREMDKRIALLGIVSLAIMLFWPMLKNKYLKKIPPSLLVLLLTIPASILMNMDTESPAYTLVKVGSLAEAIGINVDFSGFSQTRIFIKYVIMFSLVGSLESLLTVKAVDMLDPYMRKSDTNKDLIAIGIGNTLAAIIGGLPMISEVARSSANVSVGGKTRWANFFHGLFLLIFSLFAFQVLELIPNAALAAMLIAVGFKITHPREFVKTYRIGAESLMVFLTTIFFTLFEDLLVGIAAGIFMKLLIHLIKGARIKNLFRASLQVRSEGKTHRIKIYHAAIFSNFLGIKERLEALPRAEHIIIELNDTSMIDYSVMESLHHFKHEYELGGGRFELEGLEQMKPQSSHPFAGRVR